MSGEQKHQENITGIKEQREALPEIQDRAEVSSTAAEGSAVTQEPAAAQAEAGRKGNDTAHAQSDKKEAEAVLTADKKEAEAVLTADKKEAGAAETAGKTEASDLAAKEEKGVASGLDNEPGSGQSESELGADSGRAEAENVPDGGGAEPESVPDGSQAKADDGRAEAENVPDGGCAEAENVPDDGRAEAENVADDGQAVAGNGSDGVGNGAGSVPESGESSGPAAASPSEKPVRTGSRYPEKNRPSAAAVSPVISPKKPVDRQKRKKRIKIGLIAAACLFAVLYIGTALYFKDHFYQNTVIFGIECSQKTIAEVKEEVARKLDKYKLVIEERGGKKETLDASQIGLEFLDNNSIDTMLKKQYSFIWPVMSNRNKKDLSSIGFTYDPKKTEESIYELDCMDLTKTVAPKDAYITVHPDGYQVEKEIQGNTVDAEKVIEVIEAALDEGVQQVLLDDDCYRKPEILQDDEALNAEVEAKNAVTRARIVMDFGDKTEVINAKTLDAWMTQLDDGTYVIDNMFVEDYVNHLAETYDTFGLPHVFHTAYGTDLTLYDGDYGWMMARDDTTLELVKAINEGYRGELEPVYWYSAQSRGTNDIGGTYIEICIQDQRMMFFKDWECIVDTPVVTGNPGRGNGTPTGGVWAIDAKMRNYTLVGQGYRAPVDYWLPFNGNVGIHDMQTRGAFGGSIYLYAGSHGCVNTPYDAVSVIYENVSIGTPVIVYNNAWEP